MLYFLATPIGNIFDISIRALEVLENCNKILCEDTRVAKRLIYLLHDRGLLKKIDFDYLSLHSHNEKSRLNSLSKDFFQNNNVIFMSDAGMPCISDPGVELVGFLQQNDIPYTLIPGPSSVISTIALSGFEGGFSFYGFSPHKLQNKSHFLHRVLDSALNALFLESTHRILETLELLATFAPDRKIFIAKELTKLYERFYFGSIQEVFDTLKTQNLNGEWVIAIQAGQKQEKTLNLNDIKNLSLPPKIKAKLCAKLTNKSIEECYLEIINPKVKANDRI